MSESIYYRPIRRCEYGDFENDSCFIKNACKGRIMKSRLQESFTLTCYKPQVRVKECLHGCASVDYTSSFAPRNKWEYHYTFSWCTNRLLQAEKTPRRHFGICKRCRDHRHDHYNDCNRRYFAEVTGEVPRSCQVHPSGSHQIVKEANSFDLFAAFAEEEDECTITWWPQYGRFNYVCENRIRIATHIATTDANAE
ncbi:unnamed protein product [Albugo candida]|uniref:Uncharacterized protein n=1 Tax=Albugo candida TaxID=65357 RepID=A0A024FWS8_9STRA|nr:unnamed protein product [Albugo candida]|eukprot:CCI11560.1 unnamed protein product [Albugo candida]